ncbi:DegQ family serine endoprotease [uncultured Cohaesibacter sp.]|uniref:DegQ family serine endoprotease n=1 Tax=uncultured Cohaesibacter sp. TaxID=1002546 RepID=UPI00292F71DD|nr:DegQ family serine endoprotease [uncultured Cohaesibacter sp.]
MTNKKGIAAVAALVLAASGGFFIADYVHISNAASPVSGSASAPVQVTPVANRVPANQAEMKLSFAPLVKEAAPAVVNVYAFRKVVTRDQSPFFRDPFFQQFFGGGGFGAPRERVQRSLGSGVIVDHTGVIVTNHHVVDGATEVKVALADRTEFEADVVLDDERTDLAILKIRDLDKDLPHLEFSDSDNLEVGDLVLAIGNPFGVGQTVTSGIVSAVARTQVGATDYRYFIQTDAAINPGNSGGALVDMQGRLVGINSSIYTRSGGSNGIGFAIPANMVKLVSDAAISGNKVQRAWFGGGLQMVTSDIASGLGLERPQGVLVTEIYQNSPAEKAGLKVGDLILSVNGKEVSTPDGFGYRFATQPLGGDIPLEILRQGKARDLSIRAQAAPEMPPRDQRLIEGYSPFSGATVLNLSPAVAQEMGLDSGLNGVVVLEVRNGTYASRLGLKPGDIVRKINGQVVGNTKELKVLSEQDFRLWRLEIERDGKIIQTVVS